MSSPLVIRRAARDDLRGLSDLLEAVVGAGASIGFVASMTRERAEQFWSDALSSAERGHRVILVATTSDGSLLGTAQLVTALPDNQPHRADVAKMMVAPSARRQGVGRALLSAVEEEARCAGRGLLVLDTVTGSPAEHMYADAGWERVGVIPDYALWPEGTTCDSTFFYKHVGPVPPRRGGP